MLNIIIVILATIVVFILLSYRRANHRAARSSWLNVLNDIRNSIGETIIWDVPVRYSSSNYFSLFWKFLVFEGSGLLCQLENQLVFIGYFHDRQRIQKDVNSFAPFCIYDVNSDQKVRYTFDLEDMELEWVGRRLWVNGGASWFSLSSQNETHYFTSDNGNYFIFGSKSLTNKIYRRLVELKWQKK
jgi:hypothetical protein